MDNTGYLKSFQLVKDNCKRLPKIVMNDIRVSQLVIAKTNNGTAVRSYLNVGTVSQTVRSGNGPYIKRNWPYVFRLGSGLKYIPVESIIRTHIPHLAEGIFRNISLRERVYQV
jgi:hypothetical protein